MRRPRPEAAAAAAQADERTVRTTALALLAGRDFGRQELTGRLLRKGYDARVVAGVVQALVDEGLLREARYLEQFISQHARRGHGPVRIRAELREKGVAGDAADAALAQAEPDWVQLARDARRRRFGVSLPGDYRERAKQSRFLQYRGFTSDQIRAALGPDDDDFDP